MTDLEQRLAKLQKQFHGLRIMGGEGVTVHGSSARGYVVDVKPAVAQSGTTSGAGGDIFGCTDPLAINFNPAATVDDGSCEYPTGACCDIDANCTITTEADCLGDYQGDGVACDPNPCPTPTGACCLADGSCLSPVTESDCIDSFSGMYQGNGTDCSPNPCPQPPCCCGLTSFTLSGEIDLLTCDSGLHITSTIAPQVFTFDCTGVTDYTNSFSTDFADVATITCDPDCVSGTDVGCIKTAQAGMSVAIGCNQDVGGGIIGITFTFGFSLSNVVGCSVDCQLDTTGGTISGLDLACADLTGTHDVSGVPSSFGAGVSGTITWHITF